MAVYPTARTTKPFEDDRLQVKEDVITYGGPLLMVGEVAEVVGRCFITDYIDFEGFCLRRQFEMISRFLQGLLEEQMSRVFEGYPLCRNHLEQTGPDSFY